MKTYHFAWLGAHPHRSQRWLQAKLREGFDIHHLDGDRENNDPGNLVLIEHTDHMALHNGGARTLGRLKPKRPKPRANRRRKRRAMDIYEQTQDQLERTWGCSRIAAVPLKRTA